MLVRFFGYRGIVQIPLVNPKQFSSDSVFVLNEPYEWAEAIETQGATPVTLEARDPDRAQIVRVEVPGGEKIRLEIVPPGYEADRIAGANSPGLVGSDQFYWGKGWSISFVDASAFDP